MLDTKKYRIHILSVLTILALSTFIPALTYAAPLANTAKDWQHTNGNSWAQNYSPQTQINRDNVDQLEVKWVFPLESKSVAPEGLQALGVQDMSTVPPIVHNGVVYVTTSYLRTYAIDAETGKQLWTHDYVVDIEDLQQRLPISPQFVPAHSHGGRYWEDGDAIIVQGMACDFYGIDTTGATKFWVKDLCMDIPGNLVDANYIIGLGIRAQANIGTYEKGRQFIYVLPGSMHSTIWVDARHVTMGIDMDTHQVLWRLYSMPPYDRTSKDWALEECDIGYFQTYPCTEVAALNQAGLEWDWAFPGEPPSKYGGVTANWGQPVVDEDTGILYTQTGNQGPYTNVTMTPGPRLYGSTIMAIDMDTGQRIWWLQPFPHDPYDYDCNWSGVLIDHPTLGKVYMKGCKEGRLYVMDAATGEPHYVVDLVDEQLAWGQITSAGGVEMPIGLKYHLTDPFSYTDLREWNSVTDGTYCTAPCELYPYWLNGIFGTDMSYDPETQTLYHYSTALQVTIVAEHPYVEGQSVTTTRSYPVANTTIVARDVATGNVKWKWYYDIAQQRAHMVVTPEVLFSGFTDGYLRFLDTDTGALLREMNLGSSMLVGPTTGQDSNGNQMVFTLIGWTTNVFAPRTTGTLVAIGLTERARTITTTTTTTTTSTTRITTTTTSTTRITTTSTSTTTSTTTTATTTTVTSSITRTVTSTTATTVTTTLAPQTITTTTTAPAQTVTTTQEITETVGLPATVTYAAVAIAVIAIIAAAVLATRRRT